MEIDRSLEVFDIPEPPNIALGNVSQSNRKITVCIPTYNRAEYLRQSLASVLCQTFADFEVIVSDNCSTDMTSAVVDSCYDPRVRYIRNDRNIGMIHNMNQCLALATGQYVCILHDDDFYAPRFLERASAMLDRYPSVGFVHCSTYEVDSHGVRQKLVQSYPNDCFLDGKQEFLRYLCGHNVSFATVMMRREMYRQVEPFEAAYLCADWLMWIQLALQGDVAYIAEPLVSIRLHDGRASVGIEASRWCQEFLAIIDCGFQLADARCPSLVRSKEELLRQAARVQGKRFFFFAMAALADGALSIVDDYVEVLGELEQKGALRRYSLLVRALRTYRVWGGILRLIRRVRRSRAARKLSSARL